MFNFYSDNKLNMYYFSYKNIMNQLKYGGEVILLSLFFHNKEDAMKFTEEFERRVLMNTMAGGTDRRWK